MKKTIQKKSLLLKKVNIAKINLNHLPKINGGTRTTVECRGEDATLLCTHDCNNPTQESCGCLF